MNYRIEFKNLTEEQQNKFIEIYKSIPYDLVSEFREWADLMRLELDVTTTNNYTHLTVIGKQEEITMNNYDALNNDIVIEIANNQNNLHDLLTIINQLAMDKYDLGFNDGYDVGAHEGWCECYDLMNEDD